MRLWQAQRSTWGTHDAHARGAIEGCSRSLMLIATVIKSAGRWLSAWLSRACWWGMLVNLARMRVKAVERDVERIEEIEEIERENPALARARERAVWRNDGLILVPVA